MTVNVTLPIVHRRLPISCKRVNQLTFDNLKLAMLRPTRHQDCGKTLKDATGLSGGVLTFVATKKSADPSLDATGLPRGASRWLLTADPESD